jgi:hypothetical protein
MLILQLTTHHRWLSLAIAHGRPSLQNKCIFLWFKRSAPKFPRRIKREFVNINKHWDIWLGKMPSRGHLTSKIGERITFIQFVWNGYVPLFSTANHPKCFTSYSNVATTDNCFRTTLAVLLKQANHFSCNSTSTWELKCTSNPLFLLKIRNTNHYWSFLLTIFRSN